MAVSALQQLQLLRVTDDDDDDALLTCVARCTRYVDAASCARVLHALVMAATTTTTASAAADEATAAVARPHAHAVLCGVVRRTQAVLLDALDELTLHECVLATTSLLRLALHASDKDGDADHADGRRCGVAACVDAGLLRRLCDRCALLATVAERARDVVAIVRLTAAMRAVAVRDTANKAMTSQPRVDADDDVADACTHDVASAATAILAAAQQRVHTFDAHDDCLALVDALVCDGDALVCDGDKDAAGDGERHTPGRARGVAEHVHVHAMRARLRPYAIAHDGDAHGVLQLLRAVVEHVTHMTTTTTTTTRATTMMLSTSQCAAWLLHLWRLQLLCDTTTTTSSLPALSTLTRRLLRRLAAPLASLPLAESAQTACTLACMLATRLDQQQQQHMYNVHADDDNNKTDDDDDDDDMTLLMRAYVTTLRTLVRDTTALSSSSSSSSTSSANSGSSDKRCSSDVRDDAPCREAVQRWLLPVMLSLPEDALHVVYAQHGDSGRVARPRRATTATTTTHDAVSRQDTSQLLLLWLRRSFAATLQEACGLLLTHVAPLSPRYCVDVVVLTLHWRVYTPPALARARAEAAMSAAAAAAVTATSSSHGLVSYSSSSISSNSSTTGFLVAAYGALDARRAARAQADACARALAVVHAINVVDAVQLLNELVLSMHAAHASPTHTPRAAANNNNSSAVVDDDESVHAKDSNDDDSGDGVALRAMRQLSTALYARLRTPLWRAQLTQRLHTSQLTRYLTTLSKMGVTVRSEYVAVLRALATRTLTPYERVAALGVMARHGVYERTVVLDTLQQGALLAPTMLPRQKALLLHHLARVVATMPATHLRGVRNAMTMTNTTTTTATDVCTTHATATPSQRRQQPPLQQQPLLHDDDDDAVPWLRADEVASLDHLHAVFAFVGLVGLRYMGVDDTTTATTAATAVTTTEQLTWLLRGPLACTHDKITTTITTTTDASENNDDDDDGGGRVLWLCRVRAAVTLAELVCALCHVADDVDVGVRRLVVASMQTLRVRLLHTRSFFSDVAVLTRAWPVLTQYVRRVDDDNNANNDDVRDAFVQLCDTAASLLRVQLRSIAYSPQLRRNTFLFAQLSSAACLRALACNDDDDSEAASMFDRLVRHLDVASLAQLRGNAAQLADAAVLAVWLPSRYSSCSDDNDDDSVVATVLSFVLQHTDRLHAHDALRVWYALAHTHRASTSQQQQQQQGKRDMQLLDEQSAMCDQLRDAAATATRQARVTALRRKLQGAVEACVDAALRAGQLSGVERRVVAHLRERARCRDTT